MWPQEQETPQRKKNKLIITKPQQKLDAARNKKSKPCEITATDQDDMRKVHQPYGNRNAAKQTRLIEVGWKNKASQRSIQVRKNKGGGTRKLEISKLTTKADIIKTAVDLFFPNGRSVKRPISDFN